MTPPVARRSKFQAIKKRAGTGGFLPIRWLAVPRIPCAGPPPAAMASACGAARQAGPWPGTAKHVPANLHRHPENGWLKAGPDPAISWRRTCAEQRS